MPRVPTAISKHFDTLRQNTLIASLENRHDTQVPNVKGEKGSQTRVAEEESPKMNEKEKEKELNTFGVYLGSFARPPTPSQTRLLHLWDVVVLDPFADGVVSGLEAENALASSHILGRLDVVRLTRSDGSKSTKEVIGAVDAVSHVLRNVFRHQSARFTGVLLADFTLHFQPLVLNRLVNYIKSLGLDVWLELSYPNYLTLSECIQIDFHRVRGVVFRNATIRTDGLQQNVHQMGALRTAQRGIAKQKVPQGLPMMLWETVDHGAALDYAICQRTFAWCRYNSAIPWIAPSSALYDADVALEQAVTSAPLGALMWLKDENNMKAHDFWRLNNDIFQDHDDSADLYRSLDDFVPALANRLQPLSREQKSLTTAPRIPKISLPTRHSVDRLSDVFSVSVNGDSFTGLGCFHLGLEASFNDFAELVMAQREFRHLNLLRELAADEKSGILAELKAMDEARLDTNLSSPINQAVKDLLTLLTSSAEEDSRRLSIYVGLHSGFQTSAQVQFWGLYDVDAASGCITIFLSKSNANLAGTVLHTFLSSRGINRGECLLAEFAMSKANASLDKRWHLPSRIVSDVQKLSPEELLLFLRRMVDLEDGYLVGRLRCCVKYQLIEAPTLLQLRLTGSGDYLDGKVSSKELIAARLQWLTDKGASCPDLSTATALFDEVEARLYNVLMTGQSEIYAKISAVTQSLCKSAKVTASADIFLLAVFKAFQKFALDEVYLEVMDRLVYPNHAEDQAGVFAELFALGSRCESFFDTTARVIGTVLANRMRAYYMEFQPPRRPDVFTELPTAYAGMQTDDDPEDGGQEVPFHYKLTFLGIFAVPALIDITLLTTIGRGLYLTTFMSSTEKTTATTALMFALVSCGAVGGWISSGGSYYLFANAFPAMNMFVLTRFVAGIAVVLIGGTAGMITFAIIESSIVAGLVFFYYFGMLATYLMTLSALSIYQVPGSNFLSGRTVIMSRIPILFISPILTMWVGHDIIVYVCVLTLFLFTLLLGARDVMAKWSVWYLNIPTVTDGEVLKWWLAKSGTNVTAEGIGSSSAPRQALVAAVQKEQNRSWLAKWRKPTNDVLVAKLAAGYESSKFLMVWYCRFKRSRMPYVYSSSWNLTLKAGLEAMTNMQKGLKLHSAFLHWRHTGSDIWSAILYFVVALLDKWAAMLSGGALVGLSAANSEEFRLSVGFGLCYYLIGAVSLDTVSQPLWTAANEQTIQPISSIAFLRKVNRNDKAARRTLYWQNFFKFLFLHIWGMVITSAMMWLFTDSKNAAIMYIAYLGAYTGLLWFQYNKIYCGSEAARALAAAAIVGLPIGIALHVNLPTFAYSGVVSLAIGTWIACIYSLWLSKVGWPSPVARCTVDDPILFSHDEDEVNKIVYSSSTIGQDKEYSDATLEKMYIHMKNVSPDRTLRLQPTAGVGLNVMKVLINQNQIQQPAYIRKAFSTAPDMIQKTVDLWTGGKISVDLVSAQSSSYAGKFSTSACKRGDEVHLVICLGVNLSDITFQQENHRNYIIIAESIMQASAEHCLGLSHEDSLMAQVLVTVDSSRHTTKIPESIKLLMETSLPDRLQSYKDSEKIFLYHFLLKVQSETEWDRLPVSIRSYLVAKCCAEQVDLTPEQQAWIVSRCTGRDRPTVDEFLHRCDGQANLALGIRSFINEIRTDFDSGSSAPSWEDQCDLGIYSSFADPATDEVSRISTTRRSFIGVGQKMQTCIKFLVLTLTADFEYQRELDFTMKGTPAALRLPLTFFLNCIWSGCKLLQDFVLPAVLFHKRPHISSLCRNMKHMKTVMEKHRTVIESLEGPSTCFVTPIAGGGSSISQYSGHHDSEPGDQMKLMAINIYAKGMLLIRRQEYKKRDLVSEYVYGILCKVKRNCTLHVWDHCISFRELTTFMSSAVSFDSPFVNSSLIGLGHLSCVLLEHHADVVLPCAAHLNPGWEVELGTSQGAMMHRKTFQRKIDPVVNGICNMEKFEPIQKIKTATPTAIMLSHIQFVKDIKNAIMATDFIVNKWGFRDYQLHIYGDMERAAGQAVECQELIASKNLGEHCILKGLGRPDVALQDAWVFLNSSISEGLPLAMGEAALTGVPVVCTDVGASFCVVTDEESGERFSEVVAPNDSESLARAQISVMALVGQWSEYGEDEPGFSVPVLEYPTPKPESVAAIHSRMIEKQEQRRKLGMMGRKNVLKNFSSERYLREHEQMLWIGKYSSTSHRQHRRTASQKSRPQSVAESSILAQCIEQTPRSVFGSCRDSGIVTPSRTPRLSPETWDALSSKSTSPSTASTLWERIISKPLRPGYKRHRTNSSVGSSTAPDEELGIPMVSMLPEERSPNYSGTPIVSLTSAHQNPTPFYKLAQHEMNAADKTSSRLQTKYHETVGLGISLSKRPVYYHAGTASNSPLIGSPLASPALT